MAGQTTAEPTRKTRTRRKAEYLLERGDEAGNWKLATTDAFADAAAAKKYVRESGTEGTYRVLRVVDVFKAAREVKTVTKLI
jgi:hypothetical protein